MVLIIWIIGIFLTWRTAHARLYFSNNLEVPRGWRAILLLAEAIKQELVEADIDPHSMKDRQLKVEIEQRLRGGAITLADTQSPTRQRYFRGLVRRNKWWYAATLVSAIFASSIWTACPLLDYRVGTFFTYWSWGIFGALLLTQTFFQTSNSKLFATIWLELLAFILVLVYLP